MALIKSISGIRGTIGGSTVENLTPIDIAKFSAALASFIKKKADKKRVKIVVGRDARISGDMVYHVIIGTLIGMGCDVVDIGVATTPTTEMAVTFEGADGGIIITASHNPKEWNALKLLNNNGEFLNAKEGEEILKIADSQDFVFSYVDDLGKIIKKDFLSDHIQKILDLNLVDCDLIKSANFIVSIDCINSIGGVAVPLLLESLGVKNIHKINCVPDGNFAHNPEPLPENLKDLSNLVKSTSSTVGFSVDPDVDRLAIYCEDGTPFGEEYTLVAISDYLLQSKIGNTVSNLSSTRALRDITEKKGGKYFASAVGEVNVVSKMKEVNALIGGEGNGGVIYPELHSGRDALLGIALFLTYLAKSKKTPSQLLNQYPKYFMVKDKIELTQDIDIDLILDRLKLEYKNYQITDIDGVKIDFPEKWVHLRKSNTENIIRIYSEALSVKEAQDISSEIINFIKRLI